MPTYVYFCEACGSTFETVQRFSDAPLTICPEGHEGVRRVITPAGIIFKGSGWYIKDSKSDSAPRSTNGKAQKESTDSKAETTSGSKSGDGKSENSKSEAA